MNDVIAYDEDENAWLLTLPETWSGGRFLPACTIVAIRTIKETFYPANGDTDGKKKLSGCTCTLSLYWGGGGWHQEPKYKAEYSINVWNGSSVVDLTNSDFILDYNLRGRGLGSWIMQQLISWAKTLPADTPVKPIQTSPVDEDEEENTLRRDRFWNGIGFRFSPGERRSLPLYVRDLQYPEGRHCPLIAVPLHKGVDELARQCKSQKQDIENLKSRQSYYAKQIEYLTNRQWDILLTKYAFYVLFSPILIPCWIYSKVKGSVRKTNES